MHFGIISPPAPGHIYPHCMLAQKLKDAGHTISFFNIADLGLLVNRFGFDFYIIGKKEFPTGSWNKRWKPAMHGSNLWRDTRILKNHVEISECMLKELPELLSKIGIDALIVDQLQPQGATIAQKARLPFISAASILPLNADSTGTIPASFAWWQPNKGIFIRHLNKISHRIVHLLSLQYLKQVNKYRKKWGYNTYRKLEDSFSKEMQIGLFPKALDFPRPQIRGFQWMGPLSGCREKIVFPWERLGQKPLIYVSFGTIRNKISNLYKTVIKVVKTNPHLQFIISQGLWTEKDIMVEQPYPNLLIVNYAPQPEILKKAALCITHAGPGTVIESLAAAVPLLAIPIADDQPAVGARIKYHNLGRVVPYRKARLSRINKEISFLLANDRIKQNCRLISQQFNKDRLPDKEVVSLIESFFTKK